MALLSEQASNTHASGGLPRNIGKAAAVIGSRTGYARYSWPPAGSSLQGFICAWRVVMALRVLVSGLGTGNGRQIRRWYYALTLHYRCIGEYAAEELGMYAFMRMHLYMCSILRFSLPMQQTLLL